MGRMLPGGPKVRLKERSATTPHVLWYSILFSSVSVFLTRYAADKVVKTIKFEIPYIKSTFLLLAGCAFCSPLTDQNLCFTSSEVVLQISLS
jgi:hypothetical protein